MRVLVCGYEQMLVHCLESGQDVGSPGAELTGSCELLNMSSGNRTWVLW